MGIAGSPSGLSAPIARASVCIVLLIFLGAIFHGVFDHHDPHKCQALLDDGSWLNAPDENGARNPFTNWQPHGCKLRQYSRDDIHQCFEHRHMVFSGDSTTRQVFWGMARLLDRDKANEGRLNANFHESYDMEFDGIRMLQIWNPYLQTGKENPNLTRELDLFHQEKHNTVPVELQKSAALIFLGTGSWYALEFYHDDAVRKFSESFNNFTNILDISDLPPFGYAPMTEDGVGSEVFFAPVAAPFYDELPESRIGPAGIHEGEVEDINQFLFEVAGQRRVPLLRSFPALSRNQPEAMVDRNDTGFHVIDSVAEIKATILLNARCNAKLHSFKGTPYDGTCCTDYGSESLVQIFLLSIGMIYIAACIIFESLELIGWQSPAVTNMSACTFVTALLVCHLADRTQVFAKGSKEFVPSEFAILGVFAAAIGFATIGKLRPPPSMTLRPIEDARPLYRDQTDEWKGWMQAAILIYHWTGASQSLSIYICMRLMVASYLFQTGYGHTMYFLMKKDFSFKRVVSVLLRLNLLSCALPYVMNTDYMLYYFAPLVSFWYLVVYATLVLGSEYNENTTALIGKIFFSAVVCSSILLFTSFSDWVFAAMQTVFQIEWDLHEWNFRVGLDLIIVFLGMLAAIVSLRTKVWTSVLVDTRATGLIGLVLIGGYWYECDQIFTTKEDYNTWHPFVSFIPVMGYVAARNIARPVRVYFSQAFAWLGRCSLELFVLQFHLLLSSDTKGVLLIDGMTGDGSLANDRWRHLAVIVPLFLWISWQVADATGELVKAFTRDEPKESKVEEDGDAEPLLHNVSSLTYLRAAPMLSQITSTKALMYDLRVRVAALLGVMWLLNLLY